MSNVIPKEKQSAYQRWEMTSFGDDRPSVAAANQASAAAAHQASIASLAEQLAAGREEARTAGYAAGLAEGRAAGLAEGRAQAEQEKRRLQQIAEAFGAEVAQANELIAVDMLDLSLDLAKAMLKTALAVRPELIIPLVSEAIHYLPTLQQPAQLFLHPDDAQLVTSEMGDELRNTGWRIVSDAHIARGGCRVETASNQIDATTTSRWQRIAAALGKESDWLAP